MDYTSIIVRFECFMGKKMWWKRVRAKKSSLSLGRLGQCAKIMTMIRDVVFIPCKRHFMDILINSRE